MKTFITGASGHVGANLVRALIARGVEVKALVRSRSNNEALRGLEVEEVEGDLRDRASLDRALAGCDRLYHLGAFVSLRPSDRPQLFEVNVTGTMHVLAAAEKAGVVRSVVCSSFGAVGNNPNGPSDETHTVNPFGGSLDYELSKGVMEIEVHRAVARGMDIVLVNPCGIVGAHDYKPSSLGQVIIDFANRRLPAFVPGSYELVPVRDVVAGHLLAMEKGRRGERYILGSELRTIESILSALAPFAGVKVPRLKIPAAILLPLAYGTNFFLKTFLPKRPPSFTPETVRLLQSNKRADYSKAKRELGYQSTSVDEALKEAFEWFKERGAIRS